MKYIIYNEAGEILRVVDCHPTLEQIQAHDGEFILQGEANDVTQKVVGSKIVDKTPQEIAADTYTPPPEKQFEKRPAIITNEQWQDVLDRLKKLETEA